METLYLDSNNLNGSLPSALWNLTELKELLLGVNPMLTGSIPAEVENLSKLETFGAEESSLNGGIPFALGNLSQLKYLWLHKNSLSGTIPAELGRLTNLIQLHLDDNSLSGTIPAALGGLTSLTRLELQNNELSGKIPGELGNLANLVYLNLHSNQLSGEIPVELVNLTKLRGVQLQDNTDLTGVIPDDLGALTWLETLNLSGNDLTGVMPDALEALIRLRRVDLSGNTLTGGTPSWLGDLDRLEHLDLSDTQLSGSIPSSFTQTSALRTLDVTGTTVCMRPDLDFQNWLDDRGIVYRGDRCERTDRSALVALYYATDGPSWMRANWLSDAPLDDWAGVGTNGDNRVIWVLLGGHGLNGTIPPELGDLARFGRTVADHVVDAIGERLKGSPGGGSQVTLGGQRIPLESAAKGASADGAVATGKARDVLAAFADRLPGSGAEDGTGWPLWGVPGGEDAAKGRARLRHGRAHDGGGRVRYAAGQDLEDRHRDGDGGGGRARRVAVGGGP